MQTLRNIVFIPQWIAESLMIQKEPISTVLDVSQMRRFTSTNDLVGMAALNNSIGDLLGMDINLSIGNGLVDYWMKQSDIETQVFIENTIVANIEPNSSKEAFNRIINDKPVDQVNLDEFESIDLGRDVSGIILKYGFFNRSDSDHIQFQLIESILQILYVYHPHHIVASTAIGRKYLELLSNQIS